MEGRKIRSLPFRGAPRTVVPRSRPTEIGSRLAPWPRWSNEALHLAETQKKESMQKEFEKESSIEHLEKMFRRREERISR